MEIPKRIKRLLREQAEIAHDRELGAALSRLASDFRRWERGEITSFQLSDLIHAFHQGISRDLFVKYDRPTYRAGVAHALATGIIDKAQVAPELLEHLAGVIDFYESEDAK